MSKHRSTKIREQQGPDYICGDDLKLPAAILRDQIVSLSRNSSDARRNVLRSASDGLLIRYAMVISKE